MVEEKSFADTRISDEDLNELFADVTRDNKGRLLSYYNNETVLALITELRDRRAQAVTPFLSEIAMKIAVEMEAQAALRTTTAEKAETICDILSAAAPPPAQAADAAKEPQAVAVVDALKRVRSRIAENPPTHWHNGKGDVLPAGDLRLTDPLYAASYNQPLYASPPAPASGGVSVTELLPERAPLQVAYDLRDSLNSWPGPHNLTDAQRFADRVWYAARKALTGALTQPEGKEQP